MEGLSVRENAVARALADRASRMLAATLFLLAIAMAAPMLARAANPAANIDQCRNGQITAPVQCANDAWVNGNLGPENSHYREGDSVPFRATLTNLDASAGNTHTLTIQYDTLQSGKHAYDYLTSYNRTETTADATTDVPVSGPGSCFPIPVDFLLVFNNPGSSQIPGCISIWNGTITNITYGTADATGQRSVIVTFTAIDSTVLLAWGGHIATQVDWGAGNSAGAISGSPYHMRLLTLDDVGLGNQDRSLKASTISPVPTVFTTQASFGQITLSQSVTDTATLSGSNGPVTGTVKFFVCGPAGSNPDCTSGGTQVGAGPVTISAGHAVSDPFTPIATGHYCFRAEYTPDQFAPYSPSNHTDQTLECFTVNAQTALNTNAGGPFRLGVNGSVSLTDTATLSGGTSNAGGTITFTLYDDSGCTHSVGTATAAVNGADGDQYTSSPAIIVSAGGTYHWIASYTGDANNAGTTTDCGAVNENPLVINPHISVVKTPDEQVVLAGSTVSFTIQVINDGDSTLTDVKVSDAQAPGCARTSADIPGLASMPPAPAAGSTITYTCSLASANASFTNVAVATGTDQIGQDVTAQDTAHVTVVQPVTHPSISIVKNPKSQTVTRGATATFTITVTNNGDVALTNVTVSDPLSPNCNRMIGTLAPGASTSYTCARANVTTNFTNVAVASGTAGGTTVTAQDTAPVTAKAAALQPKTVTKVKPKVVSHRKPKATG
jgi:uncharacterized repeat protein (TIGR01451 family)